MANTNDGALSFEASVDNAALNRQIRETQRRISGLADNTERETGRMDTAFRRLAAGVGAYFSVQALSGFTRELIRVRGEFEQFDVAIQTILGNKARADALTAQVIDLAATTPFQLTDVTKATQQLLAYGSVAEDIADEITMLGDVASGVSQPIGDLVYLYGTLRTQGRAYTRDILQFTSRGVPIIRELAEVLGVAESQVQTLVEAGRVGFPEIEQAFRNMTREGGIFAGLMERQSATIVGQLSNLRDQWDQMLNEIGESTQGVFAGAIETARTLIENYEEIGKAIAVIITTYGAYRAAVVAVTLAKRADAFITTKAIALQKLELLQGRALTLEQARRLVQQRLLTISNLKLMASQLKLNAVMLANPYVLATTAVVGLTAAIIAYTSRASDAERAQDRFNKRMEERAKALDNEINQVNSYIQTLKEETETLFRKQIAYERLIKVMPEVFANYSREELMLKSLAELQELVNQGRDVKEIDQAKAEYQDLIDQIEQIRSRIEFFQNNRTIDVQVRNQTIEGLKDQIEDLRHELQLAESDVERLTKAEFDAQPVEQRLAHYENVRRSLRSQLEELQKVRDESSAIGMLWGGFENFIDKIRFDSLRQELENVNGIIREITPRESSTVSEQIDRLKKQLAKEKETLRQLQAPTSLFNPEEIEKTEAEIKSITDQLRALGVEGEKAAPFGSLKYWEDVAKRAEEIISLTPRENEAEIRKQQEIKTQAEQKAEEIRQLIAKRSFDEELEYKRKQYELYQRWIQFTSQEAADEQFATLIADGKGYVDFLQREIKKLQARIDSGAASNTEIEQFQTLNIELQDATGAQSKIDLFRDKLEQAKDEAISLTEYIKRLREEQDKLAGDRTDFGFSARSAVANELQQAEQERAKLLQQFFEDAQTMEEREISIQKKYNDLRAEANKQYLEGRIKDRLGAMEKINRAEQDALAEERKRLLEVSDYYQKLFGDISDYGYKTLKELAERTSEILESAKGGIDASGRKFFMVDIVSIDKEGKAVKETVKLTLEEFQRFKGQLNQLHQLTREKNPFADIAESYSDMVEAFSSGDNDKMIEAIEKFEKVAAKSLEVLNEWGEALGDIFGDRVGYAINNLTELAEGLTNVGTGVARLYAGDVVGGVTNLLKGIASIVTIGKRTKEMNREARQSIKEFYEEAERGELRYQALLRQRDREAVTRGKTTYQGLIDQLELLKSQSSEVEDAYNKIFAALQGEEYVEGQGYKHGTWFRKAKTWDIMAALAGSDYARLEKLYEEGKLKGAVKEDFEALRDLREELEAVGIDIEELQQQINELLTGTSATGLSDTLIELFKNGKMAAKDFADSFEDIMRTALINSFKYKYLEPLMAPFFEDLAGIVASGTPTEGQIAALRNQYIGLGKQAADYWNLIEEITGIDLQGNGFSNPLAGAVKGLTEETGGLIAGQMNAIRINQAESLIVGRLIATDIKSISISQAENLRLVRQSLLYQAEIASNTRYNRHLESIDRKLDALQNNSLRAGGLS